jgi:hypothetical protein
MFLISISQQYKPKIRKPWLHIQKDLIQFYWFSKINSKHHLVTQTPLKISTVTLLKSIYKSSMQLVENV